MIKVMDVAGTEKFVNCDLIERIESTPDTILFLVNGRSIIVKDTPEEVVDRIVTFKKRCSEAPPPRPDGLDSA